jgi:CelD/BcsL family acetyltransferase involved in cellulose biosynthesis
LTHEPGTRAYEKHRIGPMNVQPSSHSVATGTRTVPTDVLEPSGSVQFVVADSFEAAGLDAAEWNRAVERLGGPVYMTWHWLRIWWQFYGQRDSLRIFVFRERENIVGLLPFYVSQLGFGPLSVQVARLVGANIPPKVFDPPLASGHGRSCLARAVTTLIQRDGCDLVSVGPVSTAWADTHQPETDLSGPPPGWVAQRQRAGVYTTFDLPGSLEAYLDTLGKNEQKNRRKYELRLLRKDYPVRVETLREPYAAVQAAFERFVEQHTRQWQAEGQPGHFGAWPRALEYHRALLPAMVAEGRARLMEIWAGETMVAGQYAFAHGSRWFWELPSRAIGSQWNRYSLGPTALVVMFGEAIKEGVRRIEGGLGHYDYKLRLGAREHPVCNLWFRRSGGVGLRVRLGCLLGLQEALRWTLHKLWYRRIQPRLPPRWRRPQSKLWLRHDF